MTTGDLVFKRDPYFVQFYPLPSNTTTLKSWEFATAGVQAGIRRGSWSPTCILRRIKVHGTIPRRGRAILCIADHNQASSRHSPIGCERFELNRLGASKAGVHRSRRIGQNHRQAGRSRSLHDKGLQLSRRATIGQNPCS